MQMFRGESGLCEEQEENQWAGGQQGEGKQ